MMFKTKLCKAVNFVRRKAARASKNAGYTLLEMIVVVAMLAIGVSLVGMSINTIFSLEMRECTKKISSELGKEKVAAMTRAGDVYMRIYKEIDGIYIDTFVNDMPVDTHLEVGSAKIMIKFYSNSNALGTVLDANGIVIAFNKNYASFKNIGDSWKLYDSLHSPAYANEYYSKLVVSSGKSSRTIVLWPDTGKFSISG